MALTGLSMAFVTLLLVANIEEGHTGRVARFHHERANGGLDLRRQDNSTGQFLGVARYILTVG